MLSLKKDLFIDNKVHKGTMRRTPLRNKFIDSKIDADRLAYNRQLNCCVSLIKKKRLILLILKYVSQKAIKPFGEKWNPLFWKKVSLQKKTTLVEKTNALSYLEISSEIERVISDDRKIAKTFTTILWP